ncbi:SMI1/KNR4 family protein [Actinospica durhamensis]|uniref:SMI1/KNR4 family protein n=1 Tax=Actinospica durhamensis TaxID=1508375 RepID=A0A941EUE7_9ACTN|nr:SMI1/KNR4 family protein [Actinospica durhamensis]MBR7837428.1 SMI1/KNR4 family protein [Actinospica durhamensis]
MTDWTGVRERVLALRESEKNRVFGAIGHGFELEDSLSSDGLAELEAQLGVGLPADYRSFLMDVGAGGAGPSYGLYPVRQMAGRWHWLGDGADLADLELVHEPFPGLLDAEMLAALYAEQPDEEEFEDIEVFDAAHEAWEKRAGEIVRTPKRTAGAVCVCHHGCALRTWLIVTGPERGTMWFDTRADDGDLTPELIDGEPATFGRWYLAWLSEAEAAVPRAR